MSRHGESSGALSFLVEAFMAACFGGFAALALNVILKINADPGTTIIAGVVVGVIAYAAARLVGALRG